MNHNLTDMLTINLDIGPELCKRTEKGDSQKTKGDNFSTYIHASFGLITLTHMLDDYISWSTIIFQCYRYKIRHS